MKEQFQTILPEIEVVRTPTPRSVRGVLRAAGEEGVADFGLPIGTETRAAREYARRTSVRFSVLPCSNTAFFMFMREQYRKLTRT